VNGAVMVENMHEESVIAQRVVYDAIQSPGGVFNVTISKPMQHRVRTSRSRYEEALAKKREASAQEDRRSKERKRAADQIKQLNV